MKTVCFSDFARSVLGPVAQEAPLLGFSNGGGCDLAIDVSLGDPPPDVTPPDGPGRDDGFSWSLRPTPAGVDATIFATSARGAHDGVHDLLARLRLASSVPLAATDAPDFAIRGVIEGFYGPPFSSRERTTTLGLMHQLRLNTYLYAPKDDAYAGYKWREPYPAAAAHALARAAADARALGIDFVYGISPTLATNPKSPVDPSSSIRFSDPQDVDALIAKLRALQALGISRFAILFDDSNPELFYADDRARFGDLATAHASLANRLVQTFGGPVFFVGYYYSSVFAGWEAYLETLGTLLADTVVVLWTGPSVFAETIDAGDLTAVDQKLRRQVLIWDNAPTAPGPLTGRDPALPGAAVGLMSNATLVGDFGHPVADYWSALGPIADDLWSPATYDPAGSYARWQPTLSTMLACP